jgi:hypothetical protein
MSKMLRVMSRMLPARLHLAVGNVAMGCVRSMTHARFYARGAVLQSGITRIAPARANSPRRFCYPPRSQGQLRSSKRVGAPRAVHFRRGRGSVYRMPRRSRRRREKQGSVASRLRRARRATGRRRRIGPWHGARYLRRDIRSGGTAPGTTRKAQLSARAWHRTGHGSCLAREHGQHRTQTNPAGHRAAPGGARGSRPTACAARAGA